jgi:hypothetical protein
MDSKMLKPIIQKNDNFTVHYILDNFLLFKIKMINTTNQKQFIFFDFTYKETKFNSFFSFNEAEKELLKRFEDYSNKFNIKRKQ